MSLVFLFCTCLTWCWKWHSNNQEESCKCIVTYTDQRRMQKSKKITEKLEGSFKPKWNVICERYVFFYSDQEANENFDAFLASLRRLTSCCQFTQQEEELIKDRIILGRKDGVVQACMLTEPSLILDLEPLQPPLCKGFQTRSNNSIAPARVFRKVIQQ